MISSGRIDFSEGIDLKKTNESTECMICRYYYFKDGLKYQQYVSNECHDFSMTLKDLSNLFILTIKNVDYRVYIAGINKNDTVNILNNSDLSNNGVL